MGIRFLSKEQLEKLKPPSKGVRIEDVVRGTLAAPIEKRGYWKAHASDLTKADYCPRMVAFWREAGGPRRLEKLNPALAMTFKMGNLTASLFCEDLAGDSVWGNWVCRHCDDLIEHSYKPAPCKCHPSSTWKYEEVVFLHKETEASGSVDAFMNLATGKLTLVELKIVSPTEFEKLIMPLWEHRVRTQLYLEILRGSDHPMLEMIDTENAKVFYMCRTHGKKVSGRITPFKEFDVPSDVTKAQPYLDKAKRIKLWKETGEYPDPMCTDLDCSHAQACTYREKCAEVGGFAL